MSGTPTVIKNKISRLEKQNAEIDDKISKLQDLKKDNDKQIRELTDELIMWIVRNSKLSVDEIADAMEFGQLIKQSGTSKEDVVDLLGIPDKSVESDAADNQKAKSDMKKSDSPDKDTDLELNTILGGFTDEI